MQSSLPWVVEDLSDAKVVGGKAASLAKLKALGLRVPPAMVVTDRLLRFWLPSRWETQPDLAQLRRAIAGKPFPEGFAESLRQALRPLAAHNVAVRSSFALEDDPDALAAGVFASCIDVPPQDLFAAIRTVVASAVSEAALAYARLHNRPSLQAPVSILIHGFVAAQASGHVATSEGQTTQVWIRSGSLSPQENLELQAQAMRVESHLGASELEWVHADGAFVFVQWRPYRPPATKTWTPQPPPHPRFDVASFLQEWQWDISHNPAPLSPAHQGLVSQVQTCRLGYAQQVMGGYLFTKPTPQLAPPRLAVPQAEAAFESLKIAIEADLAAHEHAPSLQAALSLFLRHYEPLLGVLGLSFREGRNELRRFLAHHAPQCLPLLPDLLRGVSSSATQRQTMWDQVANASNKIQATALWANYVSMFGDEAAAWDLAAPTVREQPLHWRPAADGVSLSAAASLVSCERARALVQDALPRDLREAFDATLKNARTCAALAENDDALYARLQAPLRKALRHLGEQLVQQQRLDAVDDVFFLPLPLCLELQSGDGVIHANDLRKQALEAKALNRRQHQNPPPVSAPASAATTGVLRGHGTSGTATGRVFVYDGQGLPDPDAIVVARTLLPTQLPLIAAAALVIESGGPLDHVAAQARERHLPAVVGVAHACERLHNGDLVLVDANAGYVHLLQRSSEGHPKLV